MTTTRVTRCAGCGAEIIWCLNAKTSKWAPIDYDPSDGGNIALVAGGIYEIVGPPSLLDDRPRHLSHFVTCPKAGRYRKRCGTCRHSPCTCESTVG